jgi:hypothetical protein
MKGMGGETGGKAEAIKCVTVREPQDVRRSKDSQVTAGGGSAQASLRVQLRLLSISSPSSYTRSARPQAVQHNRRNQTFHAPASRPRLLQRWWWSRVVTVTVTVVVILSGGNNGGSGGGSERDSRRDPHASAAVAC